jgi:hypothetical protein
VGRHRGWVLALAVTRDNGVISGGLDGTMRILNPPGEQSRILGRRYGPVLAMAVDSHARLVVAHGQPEPRRHVRLVDARVQVDAPAHVRLGTRQGPLESLEWPAVSYIPGSLEALTVFQMTVASSDSEAAVGGLTG